MAFVPRTSSTVFSLNCSKFLPAKKINFPQRSYSGLHFRELNVTCVKATVQKQSNPSDQKNVVCLENWKIKMLYDGECPLCMREVNMLQERNKRYGTIKFVDISSKDYSPEENASLDYETVMGRIHAIDRDGTVYTDVVAFRRLYEQLGLGWIYAITKYRPVEIIANVIYSIWAKYRLQITGRPPLQTLLQEREHMVQMCAKGGNREK